MISLEYTQTRKKIGIHFLFVWRLNTTESNLQTTSNGNKTHTETMPTGIADWDCPLSGLGALAPGPGLVTLA